MSGKPRKLTPAEATAFYRDGIDQAIRTHDVALLAELIRTANTLTPEARDHLAAVIEGLLTKKIKFPNRKPKQDLEEKRQAIAEHVWRVKKTSGWKLRSVVDSVATEKKCSPQTVWAAWGIYGPALVGTELLRAKYDLDSLVDGLMAAGRAGKKLSDEEMKALNEVLQEGSALQHDFRRRNTRKYDRSK
jgi:hypothetical protein